VSSFDPQPARRGVTDPLPARALTAIIQNVMVHGAYTAQRALEAGVLDELQIHQIPVCCSAPGDGCSMYCRRASSLRSSG